MRDQITRTNNELPSTLDKFRVKINSLTYAEIAELWQQERINNEEQEMQAPPIKYVKFIRLYVIVGRIVNNKKSTAR